MPTLALSPCPNDTFVFDAWIHKKIEASIYPEVHFADIQELNMLAAKGAYDVIKMSSYAFHAVSDTYKMLPVGAAIGKFGPKLIAKDLFSVHELCNKTCAIAGINTSAYLLMRTLLPQPKKVIACPYNEIAQLVQQGICDAGVIIHETRFTFQNAGLYEVCDLGDLFTARFELPVPLGVIAIKRTCSDAHMQEVTSCIQRSLTYARQNPKSSFAFIQKMSQEKEAGVIQAHIDAYVTDETMQISERGIQALKTLFTLAETIT